MSKITKVHVNIKVHIKQTMIKHVRYQQKNSWWHLCWNHANILYIAICFNFPTLVKDFSTSCNSNLKYKTIPIIHYLRLSNKKVHTSTLSRRCWWDLSVCHARLTIVVTCCDIPLWCWRRQVYGRVWWGLNYCEKKPTLSFILSFYDLIINRYIPVVVYFYSNKFI